MIRSALFYVMLKRLLQELAITAVICFGERVLERALLPGLNRMPGHVAAADPSRADDVSTMIAEAFALLARAVATAGAAPGRPCNRLAHIRRRLCRMGLNANPAGRLTAKSVARDEMLRVR